MSSSSSEDRVIPFDLGRTVATPGALAAIDAAGGPPVALEMLGRHLAGDWGELGDEDKDANNRALIDGSRIFSAYMARDKKVWVITEADRSSTLILLPAEY